MPGADDSRDRKPARAVPNRDWTLNATSRGGILAPGMETHFGCMAGAGGGQHTLAPVGGSDLDARALGERR